MDDLGPCHFLDMVRGCEIKFTSTPTQACLARSLKFNQKESELIDEQIDSFLEKGVIELCEHERGEFVSNIFLRLKKDGPHRVILNLRALNHYVECHHFKMEPVHSCICLMEQDVFMASIDLKDAYYSIPVADHHSKFLSSNGKTSFIGSLV